MRASASFILVLCALLAGVDGFSSGAGSCDPTGSHGEPKAGTGGFSLEVPSTAAGSSTVSVKLAGDSGQAFKGFLLSTDTNDASFGNPPVGAETSSSCNSAITHSSAASKTSIEIQLTLPAADGAVQVSAVVMVSRWVWYRVTATITVGSAAPSTPAVPDTAPAPAPAQVPAPAPAPALHAAKPSSLSTTPPPERRVLTATALPNPPPSPSGMTGMTGMPNTNWHAEHEHTHGHDDRVKQASACAPSPLGYSCFNKVSEDVALHWTVGSSKRRGRRLAASHAVSAAPVNVSVGKVAFAVEARRGKMVGLSFNKVAKMYPAVAVLAWMDDEAKGHVGAYRLESYSSSGVVLDDSAINLTGTSVERLASGATVVKFTRPALPDGAPSTMGYSLGSTAAKRYHDVSFGLFEVDLLSGEVKAKEVDGAGMYRAHGAVMLIGYGLMAVGAAVSRHRNRLFAPSSANPAPWFKVHTGLNTLGLAGSIAAFAIALSRDDAFGNESAAGKDVRVAHGVLGVVLLALPLLQAVAALARPKAPAAKGEAPTQARSRWFLAHRVVGFVTVLLAAVNCMLGAKLINKKLGDESAAYMAPAGVIIAAVVVIVVVPVAGAAGGSAGGNEMKAVANGSTPNVNSGDISVKQVV